MTQKKKKVTNKSKIKKKQREEQTEEILQWVVIISLFALALIGVMRMGTVGIFLYNLFHYVLGDWYLLIFAATILWFLISIASGKKDASDEKNPVPMILIIVDLFLLCTYIKAEPLGVGFSALNYLSTHLLEYFQTNVSISLYGGLVGSFLYGCISSLFGRSGTIVIMLAILLIATVLMGFTDAYKNAFSYVIDFFKTPDSDEDEEEEETEEKEHPNLWTMINNRKEHANFIDADKPVEKESVIKIQKKLDEGEEVVVRFKPTKTQLPKNHHSMIDIRVDEDDAPTDNIEILSESDGLMENQDLKEAESKKVFMDIDELSDHNTNQRIRQTYEMPEEPLEQYFEPKPVERKPVVETIIESEPVIEDTVEVDLVQESQQVSIDTKQKTKPTIDYKNYRRPNPVRVLDPLPPKNGKNQNVEAAERKGVQLIQALQTFDINARLKDMHIGPSVTQFEVQPDANIKVSRILGLTDNIKMQLEAKDIRIEAPIPGRNAVGFEIPNEESTPVKLKELVATIPEKEKNEPLLFFLGKDLLGKTVTCRIDKMPHLLIAGATGSGKSVCMNSLICSLLLRTRPDEVKMLLIDPKKVEFTPYRNIPHLIGPVINDPSQASNALKVVVRIMDERYNIFAANAVRNISGYHELLKSKPAEEQARMDKMPYIVVIIDELADLMLVAGKEVESSIQRITQLARAAGIHLVVATQRPSSDVITGIIKANIPSRIAFSVSSSIDSRVILDHVGAERLLGNGDMLYMPIGQNSATRIQGVFVTDEEVQRICDSLSPWGPKYDDSFIMLEGVNDQEGAGGLSVSDDPLFEEVKDYVIDAQKASTSLLQRRFGIGYNRAARIIDELEQKGIIGPAKGSKPRDVYAKKESQE